MSKLNFKKVIGDIRTSLVKHSPELLVGIGIAGMVTTTVVAVRATPKAMRLLEMERDRREKESPDGAIDPLTKMDVVKIAWKCYIPSAVIGTASIACLIGASSVHTKRNAVLATAYKLSESALTEYREKVVETIGEKKEKIIRDNVAQDRVKNNPIGDNEIIITKKGNTKCLDMTSNRYFMSDIDRIKKAENNINARLLRESYVSLTDFYDEVGLSPSKISDKIGWSSNDGLIEIHLSAVLDENDEPCIGVDFRKAPHYDFDRFF